ncbi:MAG: VCBS repeat-containing protein [Steroidobacteraceae bacterium]
MNPTQPRHWNAAPRRARWMHRGVAMLMGLGLVALGTGSSGARNAAAEAGWPRFTQGQAQAAKREAQAKLRPKWSAMSWSERFSRVAKLAQKQLFAATEMQADTAAFTGNRTIIRGTTAGLFYLQREADCSLTRHSGTYDFGTSLTLSFTDTAAHLERTLHDAAGLATTAGVFANGCRDSSVGIGSRHTLYLGKTAGGKPIGANFQYDAIADSDLLEFAAIDPAITTTVQKDATQNDVDALAGGDLNGDGLDDVVALSHSTGSVKVWLTRSDGSVGKATTY